MTKSFAKGLIEKQYIRMAKLSKQYPELQHAMNQSGDFDVMVCPCCNEKDFNHDKNCELAEIHQLSAALVSEKEKQANV